MNEMSTPAKAVLMAAATLMIGFSTLASSRGNDFKPNSRLIARGDSSLAYSALTYIRWPQESFDKEDSPFVLGVLGKPSAAHEKLLASYSDGKKQIQGRSVQIRRCEDSSQAGSCHALLVTQACPDAQVQNALRVVRGKSVLTIGETGEFAESGGVLSVVKDGQDSFLELNQSAAKRQRLKVDVRLVNLSVLVQER